ncbi:MAG: PKD domain containing protein [Acetothermia bacterium 64_32]|nr:MAG: PKD domain containing protein [Acetothermia bacterium 64_32]HAF70174.1 hypothetical protein [Candidatus Acetothermia bacterium]
MRNIALLGILIVALGGLGFAQAEPLGIIIEPPEEGLTVRIWVEKPVYTLEEKVRIHFEINQDAYVYIWDIDPAGKVTLLLPNYYEPNNFFRAGTHTIPSPGKGYTFGFEPGSPTGTEWLQIMATTRPVPRISGGFSVEVPFPLLGQDPEGWRAQLEVEIQGLIPEPTDRAFDFTSFEVVSGAPPAFGTLRVTTNPSLARLYIDGVFRGWTPRTVNLVQGFHQVLIRKAGYQDYTDRVYITAGRTRTLNVNLTPLSANQPPVAQFTFSPASPEPGQWVEFDASSSYDPDGNVTNYQWDFNGDGAFDATGRLSYWRFMSPGAYRVTLQVTDDQGATARASRTVDVTSPNQPPVAQFVFSPTSPQPNRWVQFDASASYDPDGTITAYRWDFDGDGAFDATGRVVYHRFGAVGTYPVRLVVADDGGATGEVTQPVVVQAANRPPVARFTFSPTRPQLGQPVTFDATASYDPDGTITAYNWDLDGDGVFDHFGPVVTGTYYAVGTYTVTLQVVDDLGEAGEASQALQVVPAGIPGMPPMDGVPGIYVWGTDAWHITVNGSPTWTTPHAFRLELRTDGGFVSVTTEAGPAPLGLVPEPTNEGWRVAFEGAVASDRITYTFRVQGATSIYMDLRLDIDGDGDLDRSPGFVHLRQLMVSPPANPFVVGVPEGYTGAFVPSLDFRIGTALTYSERVRIVFWSTTITALEGAF